MSLGIPLQLAPALFAQALSRLFFVYGAYAIIFSELLQLIIGIGQGEPIVIAAAIVTGLPGFWLWRMMFTPPSRWQGAFYVVFVSAALTFTTWALMANNPSIASTTFAPITLLSFGLVMVCGTAGRTNERLLWAGIGFVAARIATIIGAFLADGRYEFDYRLGIGTLIILVAIFFTPRVLQVSRSAQATLDSSLELSLEDDVRSEVAREATRSLHDTLLANLALISNARPGPLSPELRAELENQLAHLHGTSWFDLVAAEPSPRSVKDAADNANANAVLNVIATAERSGLDINLTGNVLAVDALAPASLEALTGALAQCLTNVQKHSGRLSAEVVVLDAGDDVTVTVIDGGIGFDVDAVPNDRLGLRQSVRGRIQSVGGDVRVWSGEGAGTAVLMRIPVKGVS
jgi:signal transduction histidine kinase